ncbi:MAG: hypothetical protein GQ574_18850 [Crocinitomix sp.]|nr:hypothetical protein [Crocinitomix sp.]
MRLFTLFIFVALISACGGPTSEELIAENKTEAEEKFEQFYACYEIAKTTPDIQNDGINWERNDASVELEDANVYQIGIESFKDLSEPLDIELDGTRRREHADMAKFFEIDLSDKKEPHEYPIDAKYSWHKVESEYSTNAIKQFLDAKYLLINRLLENSRPYAIDAETYAAGYVRGDVLVFDLATTSLIGGFQIEAKSKDQMSLKEYSDLSSNLMADLGLRAYAGIKERFAELTPSIEDSSFEF